MKTCKKFHRFFALGIAFVVGPLTASAQTYTWTTIAGLGGVTGTNNGVGDAARFNKPMSVALNSLGNAYVADFGNDLIRGLTYNSGSSNWSVVTVAGVADSLPDHDGTNTARFKQPTAIVAATPGVLYVLDYDPSVSVWGQLRIMTSFGGSWQTTTAPVPRLRTPGATYLAFGQPMGIAINGAGELFVAAAWDNVIAKTMLQGQNWKNVAIAGDGTNFNHGAADGTNWVSRLYAPAGVGCDLAGNVYVADTSNHTIRKIAPVNGTTNWMTTTIAGQAGIPGNIDGTNGVTQFDGPDGVAVDTSGNVYVADANNNTIRKLMPQGSDWVVTTIGGQLNRSHGTNDGVGMAASFYHPAGLAVDGQGRVFVADNLNHTIRMGMPSVVSNPPPALQIASAGGAAFVLWPSSGSGYVLQTATNAGGPWVPVTGGVTTNLVFSGAMTNAQNFYRLQSQ